MQQKITSKGFTPITVLLAILVLVVLALGGWYVWHKNYSQKKVTTTSSTSQSTKQPTPTQQTADPYTGWKIYNDTDYTLASGISVKYPHDWQVNVGGKAYAWTITQNAAPQSIFTARISYLPASTTAQQEWEDCTSADSCGPTPGSTKIDGTSSTINGLDTYSTKMQGSSGIYYATVIKSNRPSSDGTAFVEILYNGNDASVLSIYKQVTASASF